MEASVLDLCKYFWRAAAICHRHGLKHSAVVIADNIDVLTNAMIKRPDVRPAPSTPTIHRDSRGRVSSVFRPSRAHPIKLTVKQTDASH